MKVGLDFSSDDVVNAFHAIPPMESVFSFMQAQIGKLERENRIRTARGYSSTLNSFSKFRNHNDLSFESFDSDLMRSYEAYLHDNKLIKNSISFYLRICRTVYNLAVDKGYTRDRSPFKHVYTGIDKTIKRAISVHEIRAIKGLDLSLEPNVEFARDLFLFSFYTRGMSYIDMAYLTVGNIRYGKLTYTRRKTGQRLSIGWEKPMQEIIEKHQDKAVCDYLLPIFQECNKGEYEELNLRFKQIGRNLKRVAKRIGLDIPLTLYVARHSWASIAKEKNVPTDVIRDGLGHDSEKTTQIYLASLNTTLVDKANQKILRALSGVL